MQVRLTATGHNPWKPGEIVTVQIETVEEDGYLCQTLETYPADLKERHQADLAGLQKASEEALADQKAQHVSEIAKLKLSIPGESLN